MRGARNLGRAAAAATGQRRSVVVKISPENFVKVTLMAFVGLAVLRMATARLGIALPGA